jgi:hypothetical protein
MSFTLKILHSILNFSQVGPKEGYIVHIVNPRLAPLILSERNLSVPQFILLRARLTLMDRCYLINSGTPSRALRQRKY